MPQAGCLGVHWGRLARDASGHELGNLPLKRSSSPGKYHASLFLHSLCPSAFRASGWGTPVFWGDPRQGPPQRSHRWGARALRFLRGGVAHLVFFLLLLEEHDLVGIGALLPLLSFKDFYHAARLRSPAGGHLQG
jgi:hypothetical protein